MDVIVYTRRDFEVKEYDIEVGFFDNVEQIKEATRKKIKEVDNVDVPVDRMRLFIGGSELKNNKNTEDYSIVQGSRIRLLYYDGDE